MNTVTAQQVTCMHGVCVLQVFAVIAAVTAAYQAPLATWLLPADALRFTVLNLLLCGLLFIPLCALLVRVMVQRHSGLDVLTLLKVDKEFE